MNRLSIAVLSFVSLALAAVAVAEPVASSNDLRLWFAQPARQWIDGLPIGNGRMGAMIMGGTADERIQFNECTLWTGQPHDYVRPGALESLNEIRKLVFDGKAKEAGDLVRKSFLSDPVRQKAFQPFGDLHLHFDGHANASDYRRELDLTTAMARVTYNVRGVTYTRESFASYPDNVIVTRISANQPGKVSFTLKMDSPHKTSNSFKAADDMLGLNGHVEDGGTKFESRVRVQHRGGSAAISDDGATVTGADDVVLTLTAATGFKNFQDITADPADRCQATLGKIASQSYEELLASQQADYRTMFQRVRLDLGLTDRAGLPTDQRVAQINKAGLDGDPALAALDFQFGRYLLISSSRPGSQPANLQGVWNDQLNPPWESKWTTNINLEMNYWPAEVANLSDCTGPLFDLIDDLVISGGRTAKEQYNCRGWVLHHNTDVWRGTAPINNIDGVWPTGGPWLCYHLWEHYLFTGDKQFLARAYPAMKGSAMFFVDNLVKDPRTGFFVTNPSFSPEQGELCAGPAMDMQLIRSNFDSTIEAAKILGTDPDFVAELTEKRKQLAPDQIGSKGQLMEWQQEDPKLDQPGNGHRHMSPLWGVYPGAQFTAELTPKLFDAAKVLMQWRGDGSTGWSYAWRIPLWARVHDGEFAYRQLGQLLAKRTFPNLLDKCGPYQIDGNFGMAAGVAELLLQSHVVGKDGVRQIELLPALPKAWPSGSVTGLCARGGFEIDMTWADGKLTMATVRSKLGTPCKLRYGEDTVDLKTGSNKSYAFDAKLQAAR